MVAIFYKKKQEEYVNRNYEKEISIREALGTSLNEKPLADPKIQADIRVRKPCLLEGLFVTFKLCTLSNSPKAVRTRCRICRRRLLRKR